MALILWRALLASLVLVSACSDTQVVETVVEKPTTVYRPEPPSEAPEAPATTKDTVGPKVLSSNPGNGYREASPSTDITITFSESLDPATVSSHTIQLKDSNGDGIAAALHYRENSRVVTIIPAAPLLDSGYYTVLLSTSLRDPAGNEKPVDDTISFRVMDLKTIAIAVGAGHMLALKENKTVWAWGRNHWGQLGDGTTTDRNRPVRVKGLSNVSAIAAVNHTSFALIEGSVWAWGSNTSGQMGDGTTTNRILPYKIPNLDSVTAISGADGAGFALKSDGSVWAWGSNRRGVLGDGTGTGDNSDHNSPVPVRVLLNQPATQISGGSNFAMALTEDPATGETSVWVWGSGASGQIGDGVSPSSATIAARPSRVLNPRGTAALSDIVEINASGARAMALTHDGKVLTWGSNSFGQLGDGTTSNRTLPWEVTGLGTVSRLAGGAFALSSFVITDGGEVWGWGNNPAAQLLFYSVNGYEVSPKKITTTSAVVDVKASLDTAAYLYSNGSIVTVGLNLNGQLGHGTASFYSYHPNRTTFPEARQVSGRLILAQDGTVWAMGRNRDCELGLSNHGSEVMVPVQMAIPTRVTQVANSGIHMLALDANKNVWAWGSNAYGELGIGTTVSPSCTPQKVKSPDGSSYLDNIESIAAGNNTEINAAVMRGTSMAIRKIPGGQNNATEVYAWGSNYNGQLGVATSTTHSTLPLKVGGLPDTVSQISVAANVMAVTSDGIVYSWGRNTSAQLCLGTYTGTHIPQRTSITNARQVAAGGLFALIALNDGTVKACGNNFRGQLGIGWDSVLSASQISDIVTVYNLSNVTSVMASLYTAYAITSDGQMWGWGTNTWGHLGTGNSSIQNVPAKVLMRDGSNFSNVTAASVYAADNTGDTTIVATAIRSDGTVWDWGYLRTPYTYMIRDGESAVSSPQTVNWP